MHIALVTVARPIASAVARIGGFTVKRPSDVGPLRSYGLSIAFIDDADGSTGIFAKYGGHEPELGVGHTAAAVPPALGSAVNPVVGWFFRR